MAGNIGGYAAPSPSPAINSGSVSQNSIGSGAITSGGIASGQVSTYHLASGAFINHAREVVPVASGSPQGAAGIITAERISGVRAVYITPSGAIGIAMAAVSGRMPAFGCVFDNVESGIQCNAHVAGFNQFTSGLADFSGYLGYRVFVGRSGEITVLSGSWNSGGYASGDLGQCLGQVANSGAVLVNVTNTYASGGPLGLNTGGRK